MKRKVIIYVIIVLIIAIGGGGVLAIKWLNKREQGTNSNIDNTSINQLEDNTVENNLQNEIQIAQIEDDENNTLNSDTNKDENTQSEIKNTNENEKNIQNSNNSTNEKDKNVTSKTEEERPSIVQSNTQTEKPKAQDNQTTTNSPKKEDNQTTTNNFKREDNQTTTENQKKENDSNPSLANTTYRVVNTEILPEIKKILEDEISKDKELVDFGTIVVSTNKSNAYANTSPFTYMFVNQIEKGKVAGNYQKFEQRVRNNVGAFGKYYIYAEDEYVYNGEGKNPKWSQTLVWIYVTF